jgi:hypothetical protein
VGVRVPACHHSEITDAGTILVLEDLSAWVPQADPVAHALVLSDLHRRWTDRAATQWPWLRRIGVATDLVSALQPELAHAFRAGRPARKRSSVG